MVPGGRPFSSSRDENKTNPASHIDKIIELSSPAAVAMGGDVGIGLSPRKFKGVIYSPQVNTVDKDYLPENKGHDEFADPNWRAVWSRHGGSFNIVVGKRPPENNCRQANSDQPVNMDFYLDFPQICCNEKGPLMFHECGDKCYDHYEGPRLIDLPLNGLGDGHSIIHVNVHE